MTREQLTERYPMLLRSMRWVAILNQSEAVSALEQYIGARDGKYDKELMSHGGCEAVAHYGGPLHLIQDAISNRHIVYRIWRP
jgi:urease gamma subunit